MRQDRLPINMSVPIEPLSLTAYVEDCRMKLWDHAFNTFFRGQSSFKKGDDFVVFNGSELVVRRVLFRYDSNKPVASLYCRLLCKFSFVCLNIYLKIYMPILLFGDGLEMSFWLDTCTGLIWIDFWV